jgi:hypothetical protein
LYNNSIFDTHPGYASGDPALNEYDDNAVAMDKTALLPGQTATFANYTSFSRGINGIMVDIMGLADAGNLTAADFQFKVGNGGAWATAPQPSDLIVRQDMGMGGSDRVTIAWNDNVIQKQWLQVTVLADANTGLAAANVFYFGNAIGESGNSPIDAVVDINDEIGSRTHKTGFSAAAIINPYDYNRDGRVNATDDLMARHNPATINALQLITAPAGTPLAAGDSLQPLRAVADVGISQPAISSAAPLLVAPVLEPVRHATPQWAAPILEPVRLAARGGFELFYVDIYPRLDLGMQSLNALHPQIMAGNSNSFIANLNAGASGQLIPAADHVNQTSRSASIQESLHDFIFSRPLPRISLVTNGDQPGNLPTPADIETYINDCMPPKTDKTFSHAIDAVLAAALRIVRRG